MISRLQLSAAGAMSWITYGARLCLQAFAALAFLFRLFLLVRFVLKLESSRVSLFGVSRYDTRNMKLVDAKPIFSSGLRESIRVRGLPCAENPSDHLPIGATFAWNEGCLPPLGIEPSGSTHLTPKSSLEDDVLELHSLLQNCPWDDEIQRTTFYECTTEVELSKGGKPTPEELQQLKLAKERKEALVAEASDDVSLILRRILQLQKKIKKSSKQK
jgi:hypothetical protein